MKPPAFQFYVDDFLSGTMMMTNGEVGLYMRLLCHQWNKGYVCESDASAMAKLYNSQECDLGKVLEKFKAGEDGKLRNERMEAVRLKQDEFRKERAETGKKGAQARWGVTNSVQPPSNPPAGSLVTPPPEDPYPYAEDIAADPGAWSLESAAIAPKKPKPPKPPPSPRPRDPLFDTLAEVCGVIGSPGRALGGQIATALADMKEQVDGQLTEDSIRTAAKAYHVKWPGVEITPTALAKWLPTLHGRTKPKVKIV